MLQPWPVAAVTWLVCGLVAAPAAQAQRVPPLGEIREAHRRLRERVPELFVKWVNVTEAHTDRETVWAIEGERYFSRVTAETAFHGEKWFYEAHFVYAPGDRPPGAVVERQTAAYDGEITTFAERRPRDGSAADFASIWLGNELSHLVVDDSYMRSQGWPRSAFPTVMVRGKALPADILTALADPSYQVEPAFRPSADAVPCVVIASPQDRLWLDPERNLALRQREWSAPGAGGPAIRLRLGGHAEVRPGVWMPREVIRELFADPAEFPGLAGKPYLSETTTVTDLSTSVPAGTFTIPLAPGTQVGDMTRSPRGGGAGSAVATSYTVPLGSSDADEVLRVAAADRLLRERELKQGRVQFAWLAAVNLGLVVLFSAGVLWRARRAATRSTGGAS